jgi:excisionase family DNA binding protein
MPRTLTLDQAAELLNTHPDTVSDCVHHRGLPAARIGRAYVLIDDDVIAWVRTQYGKWQGGQACGSISAANEERGGLISATLPASALDAALAPRTKPRRRSTPPRLRAISGVPAASEKRRG